MPGLRVGVVGLEFGATVHVPAFLSEGWTIPVVWSRRIERAREQATAFGIADATDDYATVIARTAVARGRSLRSRSIRDRRGIKMESPPRCFAGC